ncbi:MAG: methyltransferase domain-containing protein [Candidatus Heimdallarchaeota archaeon]|nr:methyltransferase domain-containing protein [Candidatus Heimdallarchaeota archaeon]
MNYKNYDQVASVYDFTRKIPNESIQFFKEKIYSFLDNKYSSSNYRILSIGVGTGRIESFITSPKHSLYGIDISTKMLQEFKKKDTSPPCYLIQADGLFLPFNKNFHLITAVHFVHLIKNYEQFISEISKSTSTLLIGNAFTNVLDHPYYLKFRDLLIENQWTEPRSDDTVVKDFQHFMTDKGFKPKMHVSKVAAEIKNLEIVDSLIKRYFTSMRDIDKEIFKNTVDDFQEYLLSSNEKISGLHSTYSITELFFYELN